MTRYQLRLLLLSVISAALLLVGAFAADWFLIDLGGPAARVDLRELRVCTTTCVVAPVSVLKGSYATLSALAFWSSLLLFVVVITQGGSRVLSSSAYPFLVRAGPALGGLAFFAAFAATHLPAPEARDIHGAAVLAITRGWGPLALLAGSLAAMVAVRYASLDLAQPDAPVDDYRPVKVERPVAGEYRQVRSPAITPTLGSPAASLSTTSTAASDARKRTPTGGMAPLTADGRTRSPTQQPPVAADTRGRTSTGEQPSAGPRTVTARGIEARPRSPSQAPLVTTPPHGVERTKAPSQPPDSGRTKPPSQPADAGRTNPPSQPPCVAQTTPHSTAIPGPNEGDIPSRARSSSSGPIDISARLGATGLGSSAEIAIRPPPPEPPVIPDDQIPVAPESGLIIRKRTPSAAPLASATAAMLASSVPSAEPTDATPALPDVGITIRTKPPSVAPPPMMASVASALGLAHDPLRDRAKYAVTTAKISSAGIDASRIDGLTKLVRWADIVGIVARRFPPHTPYDGAHFVDIVSSAGATLRILPSTDLTGHTFVSDPVERAREIVNLFAAQALDAKLDSATKVFANGTSKAAQLKDETTLGAHDARLA